MPRGRTPGQPQPAPTPEELNRAGAPPDLARLALVVGVARVEVGWTRQQLAEASHTNHQVIVGIESGSRDPNFTTVLRICRTLGIPSLEV